MAATRVVATYLTPDGAPQTGYVEFRLVVEAYQDTLDAIITASPVIVDMDVEGKIAVNLEPTSGDDNEFVITGLTYKVTEVFTDSQGKVRDRRRYYVDIPTSAGDVDLGELATYAAPPGVTINDVLASQVAANTADIAAHDGSFDEHGLPLGGTQGYVLAKATAADGDYEWVPQTGDQFAGDHNDLTGRSAADAHPTSAITGLDSALAGKSSSTHTHTGVYDPINAASAAVAAHAAAADPHPTYMTQAESDAAYAALARGVVAGGTQGQVLAKASNSDYDQEWISLDAAAISPPLQLVGTVPTNRLIRGTAASGQSTDYFEFRDNALAQVLALTAAGDLNVGNQTGGAKLRVKGTSTSNPTMVAQVAAGQTADAFQVLSSGGTPVMTVDETGLVTAPNIGPMVMVLDAAESVPGGTPNGTIILRRPE